MISEEWVTIVTIHSSLFVILLILFLLFSWFNQEQIHREVVGVAPCIATIGIATERIACKPS